WVAVVLWFYSRANKCSLMVVHFWAKPKSAGQSSWAVIACCRNTERNCSTDRTPCLI
ncbi:hypothetical protein CEXT_293021, partial [Caerostris extrusa]